MREVKKFDTIEQYMKYLRNIIKQIERSKYE